MVTVVVLPVARLTTRTFQMFAPVPGAGGLIESVVLPGTRYSTVGGVPVGPSCALPRVLAGTVAVQTGWPVAGSRLVSPGPASISSAPGSSANCVTCPASVRRLAGSGRSGISLPAARSTRWTAVARPDGPALALWSCPYGSLSANRTFPITAYPVQRCSGTCHRTEPVVGSTSWTCVLLSRTTLCGVIGSTSSGDCALVFVYEASRCGGLPAPGAGVTRHHQKSA